ncbi:Vacuolar protein sorting-associated protein 52 [Microbotryomycetes sp. JL201]|nr:Vacuolar protein sorting-associated protein 52 [Microbotryomycetes sp. JL201]
MASIGQVIGLKPGPRSIDSNKGGPLASAYLATDPDLDPDGEFRWLATRLGLADDRRRTTDYALMAGAARELGEDVRTAYQHAIEQQARIDKLSDLHFLERARQFSDLSNVSTHISDLQGRSKTIEGRLDARRSVERALHPFLESITIPPALINTIMDTDVNEAWITAIPELDAKIGSIRSGPRVESRRNLDNVAEALRLRATSRILYFLTNQLKPFALSISPSLQQLHAQMLPYKPLFDFLRRHSTRQAHDVQKAYSNTVRWYYETAFRRYVRSLEKIRISGVSGGEVIGVVDQGVDSSLALLSKQRSPAQNFSSSANAGHSAASQTAIEYSHMNGKSVIHANSVFSKDNRPAPEVLFRSLAIVLADNARAEYAFVNAFFGSHSALGVPGTPSKLSTLRSHNGSSWISGKTPEVPGNGEQSDLLSPKHTAESESGMTSLTESVRPDTSSSAARNQAAVDAVWKTVMEPAQEYASNFTTALLESTTPPSNSISLLSMIRLNEAILSVLVSPTANALTPRPDNPTLQAGSMPSSEEEGACPPMANYLISLRMQLYPAFAKAMDSQVESLRKINGSNSSGGLFAGNKGSSVKDSVVQVIARRYAEMFDVFVKLSEIGDEDMVFSGLLRLRFELDKLLQFQSLKIADESKRRSFLVSHYQDLLTRLSRRTPP